MDHPVHHIKAHLYSTKVWKIISNRLPAKCGGGQRELQSEFHSNFSL